MKVNLKDVFLLLIFMSMGGYSFFKLLNPEQQFTGSGQVASITRSTGDLLGMSNRELTWKAIVNGQGVGLGDKILTNRRSTTEIVFNNGLKLKVEPSTLILIDQSNIEVKKGKIKVLANQRSARKVTRSNSEMTFKFNGNLISENLLKEGLEISASQENVREVFGDEELEDFEEEDEIYIENLECPHKTVAAPTFDVKEGKLVVDNIEDITSILYYNAKKEMIKQTTVFKKMDIKKSNFENVKFIGFMKNVSGCNYLTQMKPVEIEWKNINEAMELLELNIDWLSEKLMIELASKKQDYLKKRQFLLSFYGKSEELIVREENVRPGSQFAYNDKMLPYKVLVEDYYGDIEQEIVVKLPRLPAPILDFKNKKADIRILKLLKQYKGLIEYKLSIGWKGHPASESYSVNIANSDNENVIIYSNTFKENRIEWPLPYESGVYFFQVTSIDRFGVPGEPSVVGEITVGDE